jgi:putative transposase
MHDTLYSGRRFRTLNVLDDGVREILAIEVDTSLPGERVVRVLDQIKAGAACPMQSAATTGPSC